jgi:signal transduction histidine kinase
MFLRHLRRINERINLRLSVLYSLVFILSSVLLFILIYFFLSSALRKEDQTAMHLKLLELWASYETGGIETLGRQVTVEKMIGEKRFSLIRVADGRNNTLFLVIPDSWKVIPTAQLREIYTDPDNTLFKIQLNGVQSFIEIASLNLSDGNKLQVGINIAERIFALRRFRKIFALVMIPFTLLSFAGGSLLAARSFKPLKSLAAAVRRIIETGKIEARIPATDSGNELHELVRLFNRMLERIELLVETMRGALDSVAHELRTPLTRLRGTAEAALQSPNDPEVLTNALAENVEEYENILTMLNTLMDISEAETGAMKLDRQKINLSSIINDIAELYGYVTEEKKLSLSVEVPPGLYITADVNRIRQVIANLLDNAIKYTPHKGNISINGFADGNRVTIVVKDTGIGIQQDDLSKIWDKHYRSLNGKSKPGLGLGLSFVKAIVEAHHGSVHVKSKPGQGTEFSFSIPVYNKT